MKKDNKITLFAHLLVWLVLMGMPYILSYGQQQEIDRIIAHFWIPILFYAIIFYTNYFGLIDRFLFKKNTLVFILINVFMVAIFITAKEEIGSAFFMEPHKAPKDIDGKAPPLKMMIYVQMLSYLAPLLFAIAIKTTQRWVKTEAAHKQAENVRLLSELQHLQYQLQPHFFFNSLNNIYALVDISPEQAKTSIHSLSKLMRYMLYETNVETISLTKEIDFLTKYVNLMKLRVTDKTHVNCHFPKTDHDIKVVPLLFIALIENAFKHGVSAYKESDINIRMALEGKSIIFEIDNEIFPKKHDDKSGSGIGLINMEKRLHLLYPNQHTFTTTLLNNRFSVFLEIETVSS